MATGVPEREVHLNKVDFELLQEAFKQKEFRKMMADYCEEITNPDNQALYQKEMTQYEKERGNDVTFLNPKEGYVIKTSVAGDRKAFINICSNENIAKPKCSVEEIDGKRGLNWQIPYSLATPRDDYSKKRDRCVVYDVIFHPDTLRLTSNNQRFKELVNNTAFDALENTYGVDLDKKNLKQPKLSYKGYAAPSVIRKPDPDFKPESLDTEGLSAEVIEKLYPQKCPNVQLSEPLKPKSKSKNKPVKKTESKNAYTIPKYIIKQQKKIDMQDYTNDKDCKTESAIPTKIVVEINLPLVSSTADCILDVKGKHLSLVCEKPARYKLNTTLPYSVDDENGDAKFDKCKRLLIVTLPVVNTYKSAYVTSFKDSGVESEENSNDEELNRESLVTELGSVSTDTKTELVTEEKKAESFLIPTLSYNFPSFTHNALDNVLAFTFHVKNTDPDSVLLKKYDNNSLQVKFTSIGSGYVPVYYTAFIKFADNIEIESSSAEAWDNNVILQLEFKNNSPLSCEIGLTDESLEKIHLEPAPTQICDKQDEVAEEKEEKVEKPTVEVSTSGQETNISVTSNDSESECSNESEKEKQIVWIESSSSEGSTKGILRKTMSRSMSESSAGDIASSADYISSDCIPEEGSLKKTVRFSNVINRQFYRYNSSIEGQKRKNQRKKIKKRNQERRRSESEAEEESGATRDVKKVEAKSSEEKARRDSGVGSDAEAEAKKVEDSPSKSCDKVKHSTQFYDPEKLNKGLYLEVNFKNELIFDLDM